jgi:hypothetical protein
MVFFILAITSFIACSRNEKAIAEDDSEWEEMDSFHLIMAEAFHPYKDSANLEPVRRLADELAQQAEKWASAPLPDKIKNDEMKAQLNQLISDTRALSAKIQSGASDEEIGTMLQNLHESFHSIMEAWNGGHHEHKH